MGGGRGEDEKEWELGRESRKKGGGGGKGSVRGRKEGGRRRRRKREGEHKGGGGGESMHAPTNHTLFTILPVDARQTATAAVVSVAHHTVI